MLVNLVAVLAAVVAVEGIWYVGAALWAPDGGRERPRAEGRKTRTMSKPISR